MGSWDQVPVAGAAKAPAKSGWDAVPVAGGMPAGMTVQGAPGGVPPAPVAEGVLPPKPAPAPPSLAARVLGSSEDWKNLALNLKAGFEQPGYSAGQAMQHVAHSLGLQDDKGFQQFQQDQRDRQQTWDTQAAKTWGGGAVQGVGAMAGVAPALALAPAGLAAVPAVGAASSLIQPKREDGSNYAGQVSSDAMNGAIAAMALPAAAGILKLGKSLSVPSAQNILDKLGEKLGGKAPGVALQDAANAKYNAAWDEFSKAIAPVDAQAGGVSMNYTTAIDKLKDVLGIGSRRAPMSMPDERRKVLTSLLQDLQEAGDPRGNVSNTFADAIGVAKRLGSQERILAVKHGDTEAREMLGEVRDAILKSMEESNPGLSDSAKEARKVFATKVVPLFDKSEGGHFLTQIRDTPTPGDLLGSANQGTLTRMKPDKAAIIAKGSSADPLLYSYLEAAITQANGKPGSFATSLQKAMPAIEQIADAETLQALQGAVKIAKTAKWTGMLANMAGGAALGAGNPALGASAGLVASFNPSFTGPGLIWKLLQAPATRKLFMTAANVPAGNSKGLALIASSIANHATAEQHPPELPK